MQKISIDGVVYSNVGNIEQDIEENLYHNVTALDGTTYKKTRYTKTNYRVSFFNLIDGVYTALKAVIKANKDTPILCGIPIDNSFDFEYNKYYITITSETFKGYLPTGQYKTGLTIELKKEKADGIYEGEIEIE